MQVRLEVVADLAPGIVAVVGRRHLLTVAGRVVAAVALAVAAAETPVGAAAADGFTSVDLAAVALHVDRRIGVRLEGVVPRRGKQIDVDEGKARSEANPVRPGDDVHAIDHARIELAEHGVHVEPGGHPVGVVRVGVDLAPSVSANVRVERHRGTPLHFDVVDGTVLAQGLCGVYAGLLGRNIENSCRSGRTWRRLRHFR